LRTFSETWGVCVSGWWIFARRCRVTHVHDGDRLLAGRTEVLDHVLDQHAALGDLALCGEESV
jgi:hypothetical protein